MNFKINFGLNKKQLPFYYFLSFINSKLSQMNFGTTLPTGLSFMSGAQQPQQSFPSLQQGQQTTQFPPLQPPQQFSQPPQQAPMQQQIPGMSSGFGAQPTQTNQSAIFNGLSDYIRTFVLQPLSEYFAKRGMNISVDELASVTMLAPASHAAPLAPTSGIATMSSMGMGTLAPASAAKGAAKEKPVLLQPTETSCLHKFGRGVNQGRFCGKTREMGSEHCKEHGKKATSTTTSALGQTSFAAPSMFGGGLGGGFGATSQMPAINNAFSGTPPVVGGQQFGQSFGQSFGAPQQGSSSNPNTFTLPTASQPLFGNSNFGQQQQLPLSQPQQTQQLPLLQPQQPQQLPTSLASFTLPPPTTSAPAPTPAPQTKTTQLNVTQIPGKPGMMVVTDGPHRLVVRNSTVPNQIVCVGVQDAEGNIVTSLTSDQMREAQEKGLTIVDAATPAFGANTQTVMFGAAQQPATQSLTQPLNVALPANSSPATALPTGLPAGLPTGLPTALPTASPAPTTISLLATLPTASSTVSPTETGNLAPIPSSLTATLPTTTTQN